MVLQEIDDAVNLDEEQEYEQRIIDCIRQEKSINIIDIASRLIETGPFDYSQFQSALLSLLSSQQIKLTNDRKLTL